MLQITYIAKLNQTNSIIQDMLCTNFDAEISLISHQEALELSEATSTDLIIYDLNTSMSNINAPQQVQTISNLFYDTPLITLQPYVNEKFVQSLQEAGSAIVLPITPSEMEVRKAVNEALNGMRP